MQKLGIKHWQPGLVLAKPVENDNGMILAAQGAELTDKTLSILENRGVTVIYVEGHPVDLPGQHPMALEERLASLDRGFANHDDNDFMMRIKNMFVEAFRKMATEDHQLEEAEKLEVNDDN
ncbi:MAG: hypothetical protein GY835_07645 [bacterium]|nr:hypothetical protein [bacterium]